MATSCITVGLDLGDKRHAVCALNDAGQVALRTSIAATAAGLRGLIARVGRCRVALEAGTHSPWVSHELDGLGCEVLVANPRRTRAIWDRVDKSDGSDAEMLARLARVDPQLLRPIHHRGREAQADLALIKARSALVRARTGLISHARTLVKSFGERLPTCDADSFARRVWEAIPAAVTVALEPIVRTVGELTEKIRGYERRIEALSAQKYPETGLLRAVPGVGPLTALAFVLTIEDPKRFAKSRSVGVYLGLTPRRDPSGGCDRQLRITKAGDSLMRWLLVQCAQRILSPRGPDSALRQAGLRQMERGGKNAKKRAIVAVARKLAVVLHRLWRDQAVYRPHPRADAQSQAA